MSLEIELKQFVGNLVSDTLRDVLTRLEQLKAQADRLDRTQAELQSNIQSAYQGIAQLQSQVNQRIVEIEQAAVSQANSFQGQLDAKVGVVLKAQQAQEAQHREALRLAANAHQDAVSGLTVTINKLLDEWLRYRRQVAA